MSLKCSADPLERPRNRWPNFDEIVDFSFVFRFESVDERDSANIHCISLNFSRLYYTRILDPKTIDEGLFERVTSPNGLKESLAGIVRHPSPSLCMSTSSELFLNFAKADLPFHHTNELGELAHYVLVLYELSFECIGSLEFNEQLKPN